MCGKVAEIDTHAIFSEGDLQGSSSSSSLSSLPSPSAPSSPEMLNEDDVNMSGTGRIDGLLLPGVGGKQTKQLGLIDLWDWTGGVHLFVDWERRDWEGLDCFEVYRGDFPRSSWAARGWRLSSLSEHLLPPSCWLWHPRRRSYCRHHLLWRSLK